MEYHVGEGSAEGSVGVEGGPPEGDTPLGNVVHIEVDRGRGFEGDQSEVQLQALHDEVRPRRRAEHVAEQHFSPETRLTSTH